MNLDPNDPLVRTAVFGRQVEDFFESDIGKFLVEKSDLQRDMAIDALKRVAPWRRRRIQQLQNQIAVAEWFQQWLADAVMDGQQAMRVIEGDDE